MVQFEAQNVYKSYLNLENHLEQSECMHDLFISVLIGAIVSYCLIASPPDLS